MKNKREKFGVSEIIGTMILLGISVSLFSVVQFIVFAYPFPPSPPSANIIGTVEVNNTLLILEHQGGDSLSLETQISFIIKNQSTESIIVINASDSDYLGDRNNDNRWGIGEILIFDTSNYTSNPIYNLTGKYIGVSVIDVESNSIIMRAVLQKPEA